MIVQFPLALQIQLAFTQIVTWCNKLAVTVSLFPHELVTFFNEVIDINLILQLWYPNLFL